MKKYFTDETTKNKSFLNFVKRYKDDTYVNTSYGKTSNNIDDEVISFSISDDSSEKNSSSKINPNQFKKFCMDIEKKLNLNTKV